MAIVEKDFSALSKNLMSSLEGHDLSKLAIPRSLDLYKLFGESQTDKLQLLTKQMAESLKVHQSLLQTMAPQLSEMAELIKMNYQPQMEAFQSAISLLQPFISTAELVSKQLQVIPIPQGLSSNALLSLSSFNTFQRLSEVYEEFDEINPLSLGNSGEIREAISQNTEMLIEIKELITNKNQNELQPGDIPELIYLYLIKKIPFLDKKKYGFIVFLFYATLYTYERYADFQQGEKIEEIYDHQVNTDENIIKMDLEIENNGNKVDEIGADIDSMRSQIKELDNKLDLLIDEILKQRILE